MLERWFSILAVVVTILSRVSDDEGAEAELRVAVLHIGPIEDLGWMNLFLSNTLQLAVGMKSK